MSMRLVFLKAIYPTKSFMLFKPLHSQKRFLFLQSFGFKLSQIAFICFIQVCEKYLQLFVSEEPDARNDRLDARTILK